MYTVKQLSDFAGVSVRTLHYYDEIGLLKPAAVGRNGYRYYQEADLLRLQQILFYREIDLGLSQIKEILDSPDFDLVSALQAHRQALQTKIERMQTLINTLDNTVLHLVGDIKMSKKQKIFEGFSEEKQAQYQEEAMRRFGQLPDPWRVDDDVRDLRPRELTAWVRIVIAQVEAEVDLRIGRAVGQGDGEEGRETLA